MRSMKLVGCAGLGALALAWVVSCGGQTQPLGDVAGGSGGAAGRSTSGSALGEAGAGGDGDEQGGKTGVGATGNAPSAGFTGQVPSAGGTGNAWGVHPCETACVRDVFAEDVADCKLCHAAKTSADGGLQSSGLDLESPNPTARLKDVPAKHADISMPNPTCPVGDKLIDTASPEDSWLLKKLRGQQGSCGFPDPQIGPLPPSEMACMEKYVYCVAGKPLPR